LRAIATCFECKKINCCHVILAQTQIQDMGTRKDVLITSLLSANILEHFQTKKYILTASVAYLCYIRVRNGAPSSDQ
jgi:hypothetical protein